MVIVTGKSLFVTPQYDVIFTFANQRFGEHIMHIILHALSILVVAQSITVMNVTYQRSKLGNRSKTQHSKLSQSSSQLQKYPATRQNTGVEHTQRYVSEVQNFKNMWLRIKTAE